MNLYKFLLQYYYVGISTTLSCSSQHYTLELIAYFIFICYICNI